MRTAWILLIAMEQLLLVGFIVCHCFSLLLNSFILGTDIVRLQPNTDTYLEKILRTVCHLLQIAITSVAVGCTGSALHAGVQVSWMEPLFVTTLEANVTMVVRCFLKKYAMRKLLTLPQVARNLRGFARPAWIASCFYAIGLVHVTLNLAYDMR